MRQQSSLWIEQTLAALVLLAVMAIGTVIFAREANGQDGFDLPMPPARFGDSPSKPETPQPVPDDGEDPRDTPPPVFYGEEIDTETDSVFYVLDVSGSMAYDVEIYQGTDGLTVISSRLTRAKAEVIRSIKGLSENFKFNVLAYDCAVGQWSPLMLDATPPNKERAVAWVSGLFPRGATGTGPAVAVALGDRDNRSVVLLTDGSPNCGAGSPSGHRSMIRNANLQGATINVFGISARGSYRAFCQGVATDSGGAYVDVP